MERRSFVGTLLAALGLAKLAPAEEMPVRIFTTGSSTPLAASYRDNAGRTFVQHRTHTQLKAGQFVTAEWNHYAVSAARQGDPIYGVAASDAKAGEYIMIQVSGPAQVRG